MKCVRFIQRARAKEWIQLQPNRELTNPQLFAEVGEAGTAMCAEGNVCVCAGNVFVYDRNGKQIELIEVPERPSAIVFGGSDELTLYIAARTSLYSVHPKAEK